MSPNSRVIFLWLRSALAGVTDDIERYAAEQSDFAFEMEILQLFKGNYAGKTGWGGLYYDPNTGKQREYDIRTELSIDIHRPIYWINLAIECKHLKQTYPLVISCTPRNESEQCIDSWRWPIAEDGYFVESKGYTRESAPKDPHYKQYCCRPTLFYPLNDSVGRSLTQVGKDENGNLTVANGEIFNKWSQALASLHGMLDDVLTRNSPEDRHNLAFLPVVVVPDKTLWQINYSPDGQQIEEPRQVDSISYWIGISYSMKKGTRQESYNISHLHFFTRTGLLEFLRNKDHLAKAFEQY
ncbi:MAG: hypothetical protein VB042_04340 [Victivallaceae bacterium]|nr:hypothetical protein [Victivallaceae bacterium]